MREITYGRKTSGMSRRCGLRWQALILGYLSRLPKIKTWIDEHNPGDPLIPFSVALEQRLAPLSAEEKEEEQKSAGAQSALGKITQAGYASLEVCYKNRFR